MICKSDLETLNFDDILLLPQPSTIASRDDVNLYIRDEFKEGFLEYIPIFSAPMKDISEPEVVSSISKLGGIGILHRFFDYPEERFDNVDKVENSGLFGISISIHNWNQELEYLEYALQKNCSFVVIDTASGYLSKTMEAVLLLWNYRKNKRLNFKIIVGNVVDQIGCHNLSLVGADMLRIGIGTGALCLTSKSIGIGCPTLTSIRDCAKNKEKFPNVKLIADGGIYTPGDALKALVFGADGIMMGSLFGRAKEAGNNGVIYGMSSFKLQERMNKTKKSNEGSVTLIPKEEIKPLKEIWDEFTYGLKSGLSYLGCSDINDLHNMQIEYIISHR